MTEEKTKSEAAVKLAKFSRYSIAGRLFPGIAHNINTPLQIITMQVELFRVQTEKALDAGKVATADEYRKLMDKGCDRLEKISRAVKDITTILNNASLRYVREDEVERTVFPRAMLDEELRFCRSDMFFKHKLEISRSTSGEGFCLQTCPVFVRDMFCSILLACTEQLRYSREVPRLGIVETYDPGSCNIVFEISDAFDPELHETSSLDSVQLDMDVISGISWQRFMLAMARMNAGLVGGAITLEKSAIVFSCSA
jgi:hypothetical protein